MLSETTKDALVVRFVIMLFSLAMDHPRSATLKVTPRCGPTRLRRGHPLANGPRHQPEIHPRLRRPRLARAPRPRGLPASDAAMRAKRRRVLGHPSAFPAAAHEIPRPSRRRERPRPGWTRALPAPRRNPALAFLRRRAVLAEAPAHTDGDRRAPAHTLATTRSTSRPLMSATAR